MNTMYETLLHMPLFQGLGTDEITQIIGKVELHFTKHKQGETLIKSGETCDKLTFLLKGELIMESKSFDNNFVLKEYMAAPMLIEPYSLSGVTTKYVSTYVAESDVNLISIDKVFILTELDKYDVFRLNYRNIVCNRAQILYDKLWQTSMSCVEVKLVDFFLKHCEKGIGRKVLKMRMEDFAVMIGETRASVSKCLNQLEESKLVILRRGEIEIPDLYLLKLWKEKF